MICLFCHFPITEGLVHRNLADFHKPCIDELEARIKRVTAKNYVKQRKTRRKGWRNYAPV